MKQTIYILSILGSLSMYSQGCSDAGFCSVGNTFTDELNTSKNQLDFGGIIGGGEADIFYISPYVTYTRNFSESFTMSAKVTYSQASGDFGTRGQFGDAFLTGNYTFKEKKDKTWSTLLGFKFPFTSSNAKINGVSLPLDYQASLGTFDLIAGVGFKYKKWFFNTALQLPVFNNNKNSYFDEYSASNDFSSTNLFERKPDVLFRTTYTIQNNTKFTFKPNLLFIYRLGEDTYENLAGNRTSIDGSDGLTINANLITSYAIAKNKILEASLAFPFVVKEERPDGLTRSFTAGLIYKYAF
ncbi:hypothetical protein FLGE108171_01690 [Flavobacterium gelidilacus]|uniref:hypothetical protein n=1 Tax=Flavobacterium gelidilacus TaxID=206041 RepID=UPI00042643B4|nr:hypothetical protein [Flavobacterium gelidilacus]